MDVSVTGMQDASVTERRLLHHSGERLSMIRIGSLEVDLDRRQLSRDDVLLNVSSRAFDILAVLIEARGALVSKDDLINQVWPSTIVQENNLHVHLTGLRHLLGEHRSLLQTISGRGYRLAVAPGREGLNAAPPAADATLACQAASISSTLPASETDIIGREAAICEVMHAIDGHRYVTLAGAGGIGKTRLAIEVAHRAAKMFPDGVRFVSLASTSDPESVRLAASHALGAVQLGKALPLTLVGREIEHTRMLIVLDNCEHVIAAAAALATSLCGLGEGVRVLATSREPLKFAGEHVYRVEPLHVASHVDLKGNAAPCSAVQLFFSRARAIDPLFPSHEGIHALVHTICQRLDGLPLAIELAAARATILGVEALAARLDDRFRVLTGGTHFALPRHQTLSATFDWSHALLTEAERVTLRRLSVFASGFTMPAAVAIAADDSMDEYAVSSAVNSLVEKSLIVRPGCDRTAAYRLLETTRAYALEKLEHNGEQRRVRANHASYLASLLEDVLDAPFVQRGSDTWERDTRDMRGWLCDLRAAMNWALSSQSDDAIAEALSLRFVRLLFELSLLDECVFWARRAIDALMRLPDADSPRVRRVGMHLQAALAAAQVYLQGPNPKTRAMWSDVLSSAIALEDPALEARALWGLWNAWQFAGEARSAVAFAKRFTALSAPVSDIVRGQCMADPTDDTLGHRLMGIALHYAGDQQGAYAALQRFVPLSRNVRFSMPLGRSIDQYVVGNATLARVLWIRGQCDEAVELAARCALEACADEHAVVACYVLVEASIPVALLSGDRARAADAIDRLTEISDHAGLTVAQACRRVFRAYLMSFDDVSAEQMREFFDALASLDALGFGAPAAMLVAQYALCLGRAGRYDDAIKATMQALKRCEEAGDLWFVSELYRVRAELLIGESHSSTEPAMTAIVADVEHALVTALDIAIRQGAVSLQLRAATSLARFWTGRGHVMRAIAVLDAAMSLFVSGENAPDYQEAVRVLASIRDANLSLLRCTGALDVGEARAVSAAANSW